MMKFQIIVGYTSLTGVLNDSDAARNFARLLPLSLMLSDYASTEKVSDLPEKLNTAGTPSGYQASAGDLTYYAPWGNLAIFYKDFGYAAGLVSLGKIEGSLLALLTKSPLEARFELID